jgi:hypothetical protein
MTMMTVDPAAQYGLSVNRNHGLYPREVPYHIEKKLVVAEVYRSHVKANNPTMAGD